MSCAAWLFLGYVLGVASMVAVVALWWRKRLTEDTLRLDALERLRLRGKAKGYKWDTWPFDTDKTIRESLDELLGAEEVPQNASSTGTEPQG